MANEVDFLPVWKKGATAEERFLELAHMARTQPQRFTQVALVWFGRHPNKNPSYPHDYRFVSVGGNSHDSIALFGIGQQLAIDWAQKP